MRSSRRGLKSYKSEVGDRDVSEHIPNHIRTYI